MCGDGVIGAAVGSKSVAVSLCRAAAAASLLYVQYLFNFNNCYP